ncbi:MAG: hypothetical protein MZU95_05615 [Desulfomicrobium escambiense]|nr:hypothetical protein [Desulfomicrobium escambiense]
MRSSALALRTRGQTHRPRLSQQAGRWQGGVVPEAHDGLARHKVVAQPHPDAGRRQGLTDGQHVVGCAPNCLHHY